MQHILHDFKIMWWAWWVRHPEHKAFRIELVWPIEIRRAIPTYECLWHVRFQRPGLYLLNDYVVELDYQLEHTPSEIN